MPDPRIPLKQPWVAGLLAFLLPGAGHLYQGRYFKAGVFFVSILGLFLTGMAMAEWQAVQPPEKNAFSARPGTDWLKYGAQLGVGLPAMYGLIQRERYDSQANVPVSEIDRPLTAPFVGALEYRDESSLQPNQIISGTIHLEPTPEQLGKRMITGTLETTVGDRPVTFKLTNRVELGKPIDASKGREVTAGILEDRDGREQAVGRIAGEIPRPFLNWFEAPMDDEQQRDLNRRLGKFHELAMVFTWVAGLLNVLAIWDAIEGPALGYGDEEPEPAPAT
ncbi:DUF6677 family protein [Planctomicrobium sp. SH664]|uniref:DUF6677 family protein n=1 Tax=Planctomicrobium sp. SH664 TaxID=3448125 RepID=UPI003F5CA0CC